jgi:hypothetical protein
LHQKERRLAVGEETMVAVALTDEMIGAGGALVRKLDERGLRPDDAFWLYSSDTERWKLVIAEVRFGKQGPRETYKQIQNAIAALDNEPIALASVTLARPDAPLVASLRSAVRTRPGIDGIRVTNDVINGLVIEDAYIYRLT